MHSAKHLVFRNLLLMVHFRKYDEQTAIYTNYKKFLS